MDPSGGASHQSLDAGPLLEVSPELFGREVRQLVLRAFTEEPLGMAWGAVGGARPEDDPLDVPQGLYVATMKLLWGLGEYMCRLSGLREARVSQAHDL